MPSAALRRTVRDHRIKTVLNLRGPNPSEAWYRDELAATLAEGATQVDIALSSCEWMSRIQVRTLIRLLDTCDYPVLIHCAWGSERTGLVSAITELLRPDGTLDEARAQFTLRYLFVRLGDGRIMAEYLDQYESWLQAGGLAHRPEVFRRWVADGLPAGQARAARNGPTTRIPWSSSPGPTRPARDVWHKPGDHTADSDRRPAEPIHGMSAADDELRDRLATMSTTRPIMSRESRDQPIRVRYAETDRMGLLHHANYFVYFEMGRTELLRQRGISYRDIEDAGPSPGRSSTSAASSSGPPITTTC